MTNFPSTHVHVRLHVCVSHIVLMHFCCHTPFKKRYQFYDANNVQVLALLEDESGQLNLYISDLTGVNYILSLEDLVYDSYSIDFDEVCQKKKQFFCAQYMYMHPHTAV